MSIKFCTNWVRFVGLSPSFHCAKVKSGNRPYENTKSTNIRKFTKTGIYQEKNGNDARYRKNSVKKKSNERG